MIKGEKLIRKFEKEIKELHFWNVIKKRNLKERIERVSSFEYYSENSDGTFRKMDFYDPDIDVRNRIKQDKIREGNEVVSRCLNCRLGMIFNIDPLEKIGKCDSCFTEFKLS